MSWCLLFNIWWWILCSIEQGDNDITQNMHPVFYRTKFRINIYSIFIYIHTLKNWVRCLLTMSSKLPADTFSRGNENTISRIYTHIYSLYCFVVILLYILFYRLIFSVGNGHWCAAWWPFVTTIDVMYIIKLNVYYVFIFLVILCTHTRIHTYVAYRNTIRFLVQWVRCERIYECCCWLFRCIKISCIIYKPSGIYAVHIFTSILPMKTKMKQFSESRSTKSYFSHFWNINWEKWTNKNWQIKIDFSDQRCRTVSWMYSCILITLKLKGKCE